MPQPESNTSEDRHPLVPPGSAISRCVCLGVAFEDITRITEGCGDESAALAEARHRTGCGSRCGLCLPYIQLAIKTGRTSFPVLWAEQFRTLGIDTDPEADAG